MSPLFGLPIKGLVPLGHVKSLVFGNSLISLPFFVYGGVIASNQQAFEFITQQATELATRLKVDQLELRNIKRQHESWPVKDQLYVRFRKEIDPDMDQNMKNIPRKQRRIVRKSIESGLQSVIDEEIDRFYESYAYSLHGLGTPIFPKKQFALIKEAFGEDCDILTVTHEGRLVASVMNFYFKDEVLPYYAGATPEARSLKAHDFMYWELMRRSCEKGLKWFDYGRSKVGTGSYSFKKNWGFEPEPLNYEYFLVKANQMPDVNPNNPKYKLFVNTWKKLPYSISKVIGPMVIRGIG